jgi:hypothetical protein
MINLPVFSIYTRNLTGVFITYFKEQVLFFFLQEAVGLSMNWLQIRLFGPFPSSFLLYCYGYGAANELKSVLKYPDFRFGPYSPTVSWQPDKSKVVSGSVAEPGR